MKENSELEVYAYDGSLALTKENWKCATCVNYKGVDKPCFTGHIEPGKVKTLYPDKRLEHIDECWPYVCIANDVGYTENTQNIENVHDEIVKAIKEERDYTINTSNPNIIEVKCEGNGKIYTATVVSDSDWDGNMKELAIEKAKASLNESILNEAHEISLQKEQELTDTEEQQQVNPQEAMLSGETKISWMKRVTSWTRVLNAARRTIGKKPLEKEPSDSWKAKILLAEHSPIRLLEYDWGWEKIRQWVTVHLVRHHQGVEKFVHSQRADRRELPCDRDHIYQGTKNDMDMTANAQGLINMSRKRCCNCASKETREAWAMVLDELEKTDPILRSKCVRECVYRGFCPEWMSKCGYWKTDAYKIERANYKNTMFGADVEYKTINIDNTAVKISNTGHIYDVDSNEEWIYSNKFENGHNVVYVCGKPLCCYVIEAFTDKENVSESDILHIDGNEWNNNIGNLKVIE